PSSSTAPPPAPPHTLSLHDALPIYRGRRARCGSAAGAISALRRGHEAARACGEERAALRGARRFARGRRAFAALAPVRRARAAIDRKSTRLNSSHLVISYAVFCLKK